MGAKNASSKNQILTEDLGKKLKLALENQNKFVPQGNDDIIKKLEEKGYV